jgi:hypothetical protein
VTEDLLALYCFNFASSVVKSGNVGHCELTTQQRLGIMEENWKDDHECRSTIMTYRISLKIK